jgi:hypothetical protein
MYEPKLSILQLAALDPKEYAGEIKSRLRNEEAWAVMVGPSLIGRTRTTVIRMVESIDFQRSRAISAGTAAPGWLNALDALRRLLSLRLEPLAPPDGAFRVSSNKETRAWRSFSARLAAVLVEDDHPALDSLKTPYGGLTAREWLAARDEKASA